MYTREKKKATTVIVAARARRRSLPTHLLLERVDGLSASVLASVTHAPCVQELLLRFLEIAEHDLKKQYQEAQNQRIRRHTWTATQRTDAP